MLEKQIDYLVVDLLLPLAVSKDPVIPKILKSRGKEAVMIAGPIREGKKIEAPPSTIARKYSKVLVSINSKQ